MHAGAGFRREVRCDDGDHAGQHRSLDAQSEPDEHKRSAEADYSFQHEVNRQRTKCVNSLDVSAAHSERNVECRSQGEQRDQNPDRADSDTP